MIVGLMISHFSGFATTVAAIDVFLVVTALLALVLPENEGKRLT